MSTMKDRNGNNLIEAEETKKQIERKHRTVLKKS